MRKLLLLLSVSVMLWGAGNYMSGKTYKVLTEVQKLMEQKEFNLALDELSKLENQVKKRDYDMAFVHMTFGYIYLEMEKRAFSKKRFEAALDSGVLAPLHQQNILQNLAALALEEEHYQEGIAYLQRWISLAKEPNPSILITLAMAYASLESYPESIVYAKEAIALSEKPVKEWYALLVSLYLNTNRYTDAITTLKEIVTRFGPEKRLLDQLYALHMRQEAYDEALAVLEMAHKLHFLKKESEYKQLAALYAHSLTPYKAGESLEEGVAAGAVAKNIENYTLLYNYFYSAKENKKALRYLSQAAALSPEGRLHVDLGQMLFEAERYKDAAEALEKGLKKGGIPEAEKVYLLLGVVYYEGGEEPKALEAFKKAQKGAKSRESALSWIRFLQSRL